MTKTITALAGYVLVAQETRADGAVVQMFHNSWSTGRRKIHKWLIYRDGIKVSYAVNEPDSQANFRFACQL